MTSRASLAGALPGSRLSRLLTRHPLSIGRGTGVALAILAAAALFVTLLTLGAGRPPGIDTAGHLFKAWTIARDAEQNFFSLHGWTQDWYVGHPLYYYYPPASYFVLGAFDYVLDNIDLSYRVYLFLSFFAGGVASFYLARRWLGPFAAALAAVFYQFAPYTMKMIFWEGNVPRTLTFALIPLVFYFAVRAVDEGRRRYYVALALSTAALIYVHHMPGFTTLALLAPFMLIYAFLRVPIQRLLLLGASVLLGVGLSVAWLIPAITPHDLPDTPNLSALPERLPSYSTFPSVLLDPRFQLRDFDAMNGYLGLATVLACVVALVLWRNRWMVRALGATAAIGIILSMGTNTPLYDQVDFLQRWFPERFLQPTALLLAILAAAGVQSLTRFTRLSPIPRLAVVLLAVGLVLLDSSQFLRDTQGSQTRDMELSDTRLASLWLRDRPDDRRLLALTGHDWSTSFDPARLAGINSTSGWNPEGTPHNISIGQINAALARNNFEYLRRTLAIWDVGYALIDEGLGFRADFIADLESEKWRRIDLPLENDWALLADEPAPSARVLRNPLNVAVIGSGGRVASLVSPNVGEGAGRSDVIEDQDLDYLSLFERVLLFGHRWRSTGGAEDRLRRLLAGGATLIDTLPAAPPAVLFGARVDTIRFRGTVTVRNAPGVAILPPEGVEAGPFFFGDGPWTAAVIPDGATPLLVAEIDGEQQVVAASKRVLNGEIVYLGLSLITQAHLRNDAGATGIVRAILGYDSDATLNPVPVDTSNVVWHNNEVSFDYRAAAGTTALLSMTYFPGWSAHLDGQHLPLYRHERLTLMKLPAGEHRVVLRFGLTSFQKEASLVSIASLLLLIAPWRRIARIAGFQDLVGPPSGDRGASERSTSGDRTAASDEGRVAG